MKSKRFKIVFVISPQTVVEPLGIMYLSAGLKQHGFSVCVLKFTNYEDFFFEFDALCPDVVCFSMTTGQHVSLLHLAERIKIKHPSVKIIIGGSHPTYFPQVAQEWYVDYVIRGEADYDLIELVQYLRAGIFVASGIFGNLILPQNLDELPFPDRSGVYKYPEYSNNGMRNVLTVRGCPYSCSYCISGDTLISMADGSKKLISEVKKNDIILAYSEKTKQIEKTKVVDTMTRQVDEYYELELQDGSKIKVTGEHPVQTKRGWIKVKDLQNDDEVLIEGA